MHTYIYIYSYARGADWLRLSRFSLIILQVLLSFTHIYIYTYISIHTYTVIIVTIIITIIISTLK